MEFEGDGFAAAVVGLVVLNELAVDMLVALLEVVRDRVVPAGEVAICVIDVADIVALVVEGVVVVGCGDDVGTALTAWLVVVVGDEVAFADMLPADDVAMLTAAVGNNESSFHVVAGPD